MSIGINIALLLCFLQLSCAGTRRILGEPGGGIEGLSRSGDTIIPDSGISLGDSSNRFKDIWVEGSSIHLGDIELKEDATDQGLEVGNRLHLEAEGSIGGSVCLHQGVSPDANPTGARLWVDSSGTLQILEANVNPNIKVNTPIAGVNIYNRTTGWLEGAQVTINAVDTTKIDISPGSVQIVTGTNNPVATIISWSETITYDPQLSSYTNWIGIRDDGSGGPEVVNQILFNAEERRYTALLGKVRDNAGTGPYITNIDDFERPAWGITTAFHDFVLAHGSFSIKGNDITASATDGLRLNKSAGESFRYHTEDAIGRENHHYDAAQLPRMSYDYHKQGSSQLDNHGTIQPDLMDDGAGGTKAVPTGKYTRQEIRIWPVSGAFHMTYGQSWFNSLQAAIDAGPEPMADINTKMTNGAIHIASLVIKEGTTNILTSLGATTEIIPLGGGTAGSGGGGISNIVEDITPQLGGDLDVQTNSIIATGTNSLIFETDGSDRMTIFSNGNIRIEATDIVNEVSILGSKASAIEAQIWNLLGTDTNASSKLSLITSDAGGGDPYIGFDIANIVGSWVLGVDNSDEDKFKIGAASSLGLDDKLTIQRDGYVGIGTESPDRMLHIKGANANFHLERENPFGVSFFFSNVDGVNTTHWKMEAVNNGAGAGNGIFNISDDGIDSGGVSTTRFTIDENGNIGIGTTDVDAKLDIEMGSGGTGRALGIRESAEDNFYLYANFAGTGETGNWITMKDWSDHDIMTWRGDGNVGIGTTSPDADLHINASNAQIHLGNGSQDAWLSRYTNRLQIGATEAIQFGVGTNAETGDIKMTILDNGNTVIGPGTPTTKFEVDGYTKLGSDAPAIKMKTLTGTTSATEGGDISITHGLTQSKIIGIQAFVSSSAGALILPESSETVGYHFSVWTYSANIIIKNHDTNSENILSAPITMLITYEE